MVIRAIIICLLLAGCTVPQKQSYKKPLISAPFNAASGPCTANRVITDGHGGVWLEC